MKKILTMSVREMYAMLLIGAMLLFSLIYTSMALFEKTVEKVGVATIVATEINYLLTSEESGFVINGNSGTITVPEGETKTFDITIENQIVNSTRYKVYYRFENDITILNVNVGISNKSNAPESDVITTGTSKTVRIMIENSSEQSVTIEIGVQGGYASNVVVLSSEKNEMITLKEPVSYPTFNDTSGANTPILADGMIPVVYDENQDTWLKADTEAGYYAYQKQIWANAVTVTSTNRTTYLSAEPGTPIPMEDINSMWVWIPRYRYKIESSIGIGTSASPITNPPQIDVIFENGTETNGVTEKVYRTGIASDGTNTNYYTHPSFRDIDNIEYDSSTESRGAWDEEITGFWVGKFETGTSTSSCNTSASAANCLDVEPIIKPDVQSLRYQTVSAQFITSIKFAGGTFDSETGNVTFTANENNAYGLNTTSNTTDTHIMKNTEWGAVAILSQSQYGKTGNDSYIGENKEVYKNDSGNYSTYTGRSSGLPASGYSTYGTYSYNDITCGTSSSECTGEKVAYKGTGASTTGTIYGIYDMSGGLIDRTMTNFANNDIGFTTFPSSKYYDLYQGTNSSDATKEKAILGDATWETMLWYSDYNTLVVFDSDPFTVRGESSISNVAGVFSSSYSDGSAGSSSFHAVLIP